MLLPKALREECLPEEDFVFSEIVDVVVDSRISSKINCVIEYFKRRLSEFLDFNLELSRAYEVLEKEPRPNASQICLILNEDLKESYKLRISGQRCLIEAKTYPDLVSALMSLLFIVFDEGLVISAREIEDRPRFPIRGYYYDTARGRIPKTEHVFELIEEMALLKLNHLQLYVESGFSFDGESEIWRADSPLKPEEIIAIDDYADAFGIEVVASVSSFGHLYNLLQSYTYQDDCELEVDPQRPFSYYDRMAHHTLDVASERIFQHICKRIDQYAPLLRSKSFNVCADETFDLGQGRSRARCESQGKDRVYIDFILRLEEHLKKRGLKMQFWGDVIAGFPEFAKELSSDTLCLSWDYSAEPREQAIEQLASTGMDQLLCPGVCGWNLKVNANQLAYQNNYRMCYYAEKHNALGLLNTNWGDYAHINDPVLSKVAMAYGAIFAWQGTAQTASQETIDRHLSRIFFGDPSEKLASLYSRILKSDLFPWREMVTYKEFSDHIQGDELLEAQTQVLNKFQYDSDDFKAAELELEKTRVEVMAASSHLGSKDQRRVRSSLLYAIRLTSICNQILAGLLTVNSNVEKTCVEIEYFAQAYERFWLQYDKRSELTQLLSILFYFVNQFRADKKIEA
ncbi:MAG: family 20 glycosylhydrolase [Eubacteriales bacterium]|nr:family 20 glycosylhydrolase [Eubacteriales bacterium]